MAGFFRDLRDASSVSVRSMTAADIQDSAFFWGKVLAVELCEGPFGLSGGLNVGGCTSSSALIVGTRSENTVR